jgi:hypothetical protein
MNGRNMWFLRLMAITVSVITLFTPLTWSLISGQLAGLIMVGLSLLAPSGTAFSLPYTWSPIQSTSSTLESIAISSISLRSIVAALVCPLQSITSLLTPTTLRSLAPWPDTQAKYRRRPIKSSIVRCLSVTSIFWLLYPLHAIFPLTYTPTPSSPTSSSSLQYSFYSSLRAWKQNLELLRTVSAHHETLLTFLIVTAPRKNNATALSETVESYRANFPYNTSDVFFGRVGMVVFTHSWNHPVFDALESKYASSIHFHRQNDHSPPDGFEFNANIGLLADGDGGVRTVEERNVMWKYEIEDRQGKKDYKWLQKYHFAMALRYILRRRSVSRKSNFRRNNHSSDDGGGGRSTEGRSVYVMLLEDDFPLCPGGWSKIQQALMLANFQSQMRNHCAIFVGTGGRYVNLFVSILDANVYDNVSLRVSFRLY